MIFGKNKENKKTKKKLSALSRMGIGKDKDYFIENFALLMSSGIDVISAIDSMEGEIRSGSMKKIVRDFKEELEEGIPLAKALESTGIFPEFVFSLIRIGEQSGKLPENLQLIVKQIKKDRTFRSKIQSAVLYPAFVLVLALFIGVGISWYILPKLAVVFSQLKVSLPFVTKILIEFGLFMGEHGIMVAPAFLFLVISIFYFFFIFPRTKFIGQKILFSIPGIRRLIQEVEMARMGFVFGILLEAGVPIVEAIRAVGNSTTMNNYRKFYFFLADRIEEGNFFHESFDLYPGSRHIIPSSVMQIIAAGEKSGKLSQSLMRIGDIYEEKTENTTKYLATLLEPLLLVFVWLGVVFVALAVILPIYSLVGGFNTNGNSAPPPPPPIVVSLPEDTDENSEVSEADSFEDGSENVDSVSGSFMIKIKKTEIGFLNVRAGASKKEKIVGRVLPDETFSVIQEKDGWYQIKFAKDSEEEGWVIGDYVEVEDESDL
jgi:type II secretory pathway component PulF